MEGSQATTASAPLQPVSQYMIHHLSIEQALKDRLSDPNRFQAVEDRLEGFSDLSSDSVTRQCKSRYFNRYRGCFFMKCAEDVLIYQQLFETIKPKTVLELGSYSGASALWMVDYISRLTNDQPNDGDAGALTSYDCQVYSVDIDLSFLDDKVKKLKPKNLHFIEGDCNNLESVFTPDLLSNMAHPVVFIDDAHVNTRGILDYIHPYLQAGDYIVMEDTHPALPKHTNVAKEDHAHHDQYIFWRHPKGSLTKQFMQDHDTNYAIDSFFEDMFGYRYTWNTWIRKMK